MGVPITESPMYHVPEGINPDVAYAGSEKVYLLLLQFDVTEEEGKYSQKWEFVKGRENAYNRLKEEIIDSFESHNPLLFEYSYIAVDTMKAKITDSKLVYRFMKDVINRGQIIDPDFNIDDYYTEEESSDESDNEVRYGQGEQNIPYDQSNAIDGGEV